MEGLCIGKGIVIGTNLMNELFRYKTRDSCVYNNIEVSAVLLHGTLHLKRWDDDLMGVLVVL